MRSRMNSKACLAQVQGPAQRILSSVLVRVPTGPKVTLAVLIQVVLVAACRTLSLFATCLQLGKLSDQSVRDALRKTLPKSIRRLQEKLNSALQDPLPAKTRRRKRALAIDLHDVPYHGEPKKTNDLVHHKPKSGTTTFFCYGTVCLVERGYRYTLGYTWVRRNEKMTAVLKRLLNCVRQSGVPLRHLLLDRGFYTVSVMAFLQAEKIPFLMPVIFRGRRPRPGQKLTGLRALRRGKAGWSLFTHRGKGQSVTTEICVAYRTYKHHKTHKRHQQKLVFAVWRLSGKATVIRETYRKRFAIESTYRQLGHARIRTSTSDPLLRLFFVGVSLLLRNLWVWLLWLHFGEQEDPAQQRQAKRIQLKGILLALAHQCEFRLRSLLNITPDL